ncbi:MAG: hypothetical protein BMS9Abin12_1603 [Acidimicrobiia bacterium]|nr:MAG: hypothetical protein BMS9Abin12_1603 [Acidimicrobiia bacterium]
MDIEAINDRIAEVHRDRKWILTPDVAAGVTPIVQQLREWDAAGIMVVAGVPGVGDVPEADALFYTNTSGDTIMQGVRAFVRSVDDPSDELLAAVDEFDPDGEAMVVAMGFSRSGRLAGRRVYGARAPEWADLEDKTIIDELWDQAGVIRAPSVVVPVADAVAAANGLDRGLGTVWVADNLEGWHGGGEYARWVKEEEHVQPALEWFSEHARTVRVMPFLDGIPCSIHGFITRNGVAVFLPMEMIILRNTNCPEFYYAQGANFWNPPARVRKEMRQAARLVGALLKEQHGYLGGFGIDGICTKNGFRPTELNPRLSVGHGLQSRAADVKLASIQRLMIEGVFDIDATDLEQAIVAAAETNRRGGMIFPLKGSYPPAKTGFVFEDDRAVAIDTDEPNDGTMTIGPAAFGAIVIVQLDPDRTEVGPSVAPLAIKTLDLARDLWDVDAPQLEPAPDLCS